MRVSSGFETLDSCSPQQVQVAAEYTPAGNSPARVFGEREALLRP